MTMTRSPESTLGELEALLAIDKNSLEECCRVQPTLFYQVAKQLEIAEARRDDAKQEIEKVEAKIDGQVRAEYYDEESKPREGDIKSRIRLHPEVIAANDRYLKLKLRAGKLNALVEAFKDRSQMLRRLVDLYIANYFGAEVESAPTQIRTGRAAIARSMQSRMRRERQ